jgi:4'-phosphopantetheinyl transferase
LLNLGIAACGELCAQAHDLSLDFLSDGERHYLRSVVSPKRRTQFLAGRLLARRMLCHTFGGELPDWKLTAQTGVKPMVIARPDVHLSISHSANRVVCALSDQAVGVDVETIKPGRDVRALAQLTCHPQELAFMDGLAAAELDRYFVQMWTIKEAWVKRTGGGLDLKGMRALFAKRSGDKAEAVTLMCMDGAAQQVVAVVSGQVHALRVEGEASVPVMWHLSAG